MTPCNGGLHSAIVLAIMLLIGACAATDSALEPERRTLDPAYEDIPVPRWLYIERMASEAVAHYEQRLDEYPYDIFARTKLIVHYGRQRYKDRAGGQSHARHVLWMIRNAPKAQVLQYPFTESRIDPSLEPEAYVEAKMAWESQLERNRGDIKVIDGYATFLSIYDKDRAIELLLSAQELDPDNVSWAMRLGQFYLLMSMFGSGEGVQNAADSALVQFDRALDLSRSEMTSSRLLQDRAKAAFLAKRYELAAAHAEAMIDHFKTYGNSNDGDLYHLGHTILGRVALKDGDVSRSKNHLIESARGSGSIWFGSLTPAMELALDLLERGEFDIVGEYFDLCSEFWQDDKLEKWKILVKAGVIPEFRGSVYW